MIMDIVADLHAFFDKLESDLHGLLTGKVADEVHADVTNLVQSAKDQGTELVNTAVTDAKADAATAAGDAGQVLETVDPAQNTIPGSDTAAPAASA
jgi:hypothetical protein